MVYGFGPVKSSSCSETELNTLELFSFTDFRAWLDNVADG